MQRLDNGVLDEVGDTYTVGVSPHAETTENGDRFGVVVAQAPREEAIRLHIGGGTIEIPGFTLIDRKVGKEAFPLEYPDNSVEEIYASHVLEHIGMAKAQETLREWCRVLKPGGRLRVAVPDIEKWCRGYVAGDCSVDIRHLYGGQIDDNDFHKNGWDNNGLRFELQQAGFVCTREFKAEYQDCAALPISLNIECNKPTLSIVNGKFTKRICAAMTVPRLGFTDNFCSIAEILVSAGVTLDTITGAYYNQGMEWAIEKALSHSPDYVLTIDYDTIFTVETLGRMCLLVDNYRDFDAIVPCQVRRGNEYCMFNADMSNDRWQKINYYDVFPILNGHFGFTMFRAEKFAAMKRPWFQCQPGPDGWGEGRIDGDMNFWNRWKEAGNTVGLASRVSVGHIETVVTWPDEAMRPIYQHTKEWRESGKPPGAR